MPEPDLAKLLGGFATDTLTPAERKKLFTAALQDQQLFNALTDEQALKELLADPVVRRRLLQVLAGSRASDADGWRSWLDRVTGRTGLAWAGGVVVAIFAVVLGVKIYEDNLRQAAQSVAIEETRQEPMRPAEPETKVNAAPTTGIEKKDGFADALTKREKAVPPSREKKRQPSGPDAARSDADTPVAALGKPAEPATQSADHQAVRPSTPAATPDQRIQERKSGSSARALFYAEVSALPDAGLGHRERRQGMTSSVEPALRENAPATKMDRSASPRKPPDRPGPVKPLAVRYSFVVRGADGKREVNPTAALEIPTGLYLTVESNQDAYLQIWRTRQASAPQLVLPEKESGQMSLRVSAGERHDVLWPGRSDRLIVRLARMPFGPITRQEAVLLGRGASEPLRESISDSSSGSQEHVTYVANQDASFPELAVEISTGSTQ